MNKIQHGKPVRPGYFRAGYFRPLVSLIVLFSAVWAISGCGPKKIGGLVHAEGSVVYQGTPLPWASLSFLPEVTTGGQAKMATAMTDENGRFQIRTQGADGILPGEYMVAVEKYIPNTGRNAVQQWRKQRENPGFKESRPEETLKAVPAIPLKYGNAATSGLKVTVASGGNKDMIVSVEK